MLGTEHRALHKCPELCPQPASSSSLSFSLFKGGKKNVKFIFWLKYFKIAGVKDNKDLKIPISRFPKNKQPSQVTVEEAWNCRRNLQKFPR